MFSDILLLIAAQPFAPFTVHLTSGATLKVPTVDHVSVMRVTRRIIVQNDDGRTYHILPDDQISHVTVAGQPA